ncbi:MAG: geranylgeranylglyceryl/heptaprenylglyceryl phosphate synthase [Methanobacteriota archaeon]|nr:MAG: geranylgeranylglyceryl/heptaprenylglyceryl phosphate synthase [Euryarchaeota archaeon]
MKVLDYLRARLVDGKVHLSLLDPDKLTPTEAGEVAFRAQLAGTDGIMVGGSTGVTPEKTDAAVKAIKDRARVPVILFPAGAHALSRFADAVYFMSMLNSQDVRMIVGEQRKAARAIKEWGLETIPMGYLIVEPGMRVGEVGHAKPIARDDVEDAVRYALTAQYLGMDLVYLEAGSGAPEPVPPKMISAVKAELSIPLIVGGGIRSAEAARATARAGADIVVTGTVIEEDQARLQAIVDAVKGL